MRLFGSDRIARLSGGGWEEGEPITHPWVTGAISQAQKRVELQNFQARKKLLEYDDVMNQQREVIYSLRLFALEGGEELKAEALRMIDAAVERLVDELTRHASDPAEWDRELIETEFLQQLPALRARHHRSDPVRRPGRLVARPPARRVRQAFDAKLDYLTAARSARSAPSQAGRAGARPHHAERDR